MSDHLLEVDWDVEKGWGKPRIIPYGPLPLDPAASCLHYAIECFEGMKAYIDQRGDIRLFRPDMNMTRMNNSARRLLLPEFDGNEFLKCIKELIKVDREWIPRGEGYSLYIRPTFIGTHPYLGVQPSLSAKLYCITSPVGPYYPEGFNPIKLFADPTHVRAWPGGTGSSKVGGNYALGIRPAMEAAKKGYAQVLWLFGEDLQVTEVGTMNQFFFWKREGDGKRELITAPLDGTILPGVTRDSIIQLAKQWGEFEVTERRYTLKEIMKAVKEGRMIEAFGAGTAAIVAPVKGFHYNGVDYDIPLDKENPTAKAGKLTQRLCDTIMDIQYGKVEHPWSVVVK
jgi:branched-chain amino acid aminotransferase